MRFAVLTGQQRSGTHLLGSFLGSHPNLRYLGEVFYRDAPSNERQLKSLLRGLRSGPGEKLILDIKYNQFNPTVERWAAGPDVPVIEIVRKDVLALTFSGWLHSWRGQHPESGEIPICSFQELEYFFWVGQIGEYLTKYFYLVDEFVFYEEMTRGSEIQDMPDAIGRRLCKALQVPYHPMTTGCLKEAPLNYRDHIRGIPDLVLRLSLACYDGEN